MSSSETSDASDSDVGWVLDSLVGFLKGPVWNVPIITFIEQKSVVFEPENSDDEQCEYETIYEEYKNLVDRLLGTHMEELGITPEQFEESCKKAEGALSTKFHHTLFEQIWAANDFEIFKRMMIQRNIELQLQALEILSHRFGFSLQSLIPEDNTKYDFLVDDEALMNEVIRRSLEDEGIGKSPIEGKEKVIQVTIEERQRLEAEKVKEKVRFNKAIHEAMSDEVPEKTQPEINVETTSVKSITPSTTQPQSIVHQSQPKQVSAQIEVKKKEELSDSELKVRQEYLRKQRDLLMEVKKKERRKQLDKVEESELLAKRPKSAKTVRSVFDENNSNDENDDKGLAFRKSLAARLKAEVIEGNHSLKDE